MTLSQHPIPGSFNIYRCGDLFRLTLTASNIEELPYIRTNLGSAQAQRDAIITNTEEERTTSRNNWRDIPLTQEIGDEYSITLPLSEVGHFEAKVWFKDKNKQILWAPGDNIQIKVEPASTIANNSIYAVFTRQFGPNKNKPFAQLEEAETIKDLDTKGFHVIPPSGTFRDVIKELDHIMDDMGFRILQLLPIHPTPTTYARMGRFGSPYAALDFFSVDPSLAEFDKQATPLDQLIELINAIHRKQGEIFIDIPVDHTGWASILQEEHPEYFIKDKDGNFASPGAWGTVWEDLIKLDFNKTEVHQMMAEVFLFWCAKGIDGFRCDAGYMVPFEAWQYIIAKVRTQYPNTIFLLEGLGGPSEVTQHLLAKATFSWAYSELFQNYSKDAIYHYLSDMLTTNHNMGGMVNFSETHDNNRLAEQSETWSKMRNLLCALTAPAGGFGISNGVEFFAKEKISVHHANGLNWNNEHQLSALFLRLTSIFRIHPAFFANAQINLIYHQYPNIVACKRQSVQGEALYIIINTNCESQEEITIADFSGQEAVCYDLISTNKIERTYPLEAGEALCLTYEHTQLDRITSFDIQSEDNIITRQRCQETILQIHQHLHGFSVTEEQIFNQNVNKLISDPLGFCLDSGASLSEITLWSANTDYKRHVMVCEGSILLISNDDYFDFTISDKTTTISTGCALKQPNKHFFALVPIKADASAGIKYLTIKVNAHTAKKTETKTGQLALLPSKQALHFCQVYNTKEVKSKSLYALCTNASGSMAQMNGLWGAYHSKYDSFFAVNLDQEVPVDRTTLISRFRCWVVANDFSHKLGEKSQYSFKSDGANRATWSFKAPTGQGKYVLIDIHYHLLQDAEQAFLTFSRISKEDQYDLLEAQTPVKVIIRPDIEYRSNHEVTKAFTGPEQNFPHSITLDEKTVVFKPYESAALTLKINQGEFVYETEWQYMHPLPIEADRGLESRTDLFSPGYFHFNILEEERIHLTASTEPKLNPINANAYANILDSEPVEKVLKRSLKKFIVRRNKGQTVIAGYPWFLDWGRDTLICLRGIIAAGLKNEARDIFHTFAMYEEDGTLPNMIRGNNASNRDTSDAPLWFIVALNDYIKTFRETTILNMDCKERSIKDVIVSIVKNYIAGTSNGICMDQETGLIYSPSHFTWMDTNYPAGTPRQGYPIEIQALWQHSLEFIALHTKDAQWQELANKVRKNILSLYPLNHEAGMADCLHCDHFITAKEAKKDNACRSNQIFLLTLGVVTDSVLSKSILLATQSLITPGAIKSLKDAPTHPPLPIYKDGQLLNDPQHPYWGRYSGDEDTQRKPAYHNGTGWAWPFFSYCEALYMHTKDKKNCSAILMSAQQEMEQGIVNHMPEICDGDAPHYQRGCKAQAWSITEYYRLIKFLSQ